MKNFLGKIKKVFSGFVALSMIVTLLPMTALADPDPNQNPDPQGPTAFDCDFGNGAWEVNGVTVTASINDTAVSGELNVETSTAIHLENYNSESMEAKFVAQDGYTFRPEADANSNISLDGITPPQDYGKLVFSVVPKSDGNEGGGGNPNPPQNADPFIILLGPSPEENIVLFENGEVVNTVDGITITVDNGEPSIEMKDFQSGYVLEIDGGIRDFTVNGENSLYGLAIGDNVDFQIWGKDFSTLSIGGDGIRGGDNSGICFRDDVKLYIDADSSAFDGVDHVIFNNFNFHEREALNANIKANDHAFNDAEKVEVLSAKVRFEEIDGGNGALFAKNGGEPTDLIVSEEGWATMDGDLGYVRRWSRYYSTYPGDGDPIDGVAIDINNYKTQCDVDDTDNLTDADKASFKEEGSTLISLDPILYSVSYQVDPGIKEARDDNGNLVFGDPDAGELFMNGFKKGYWVKNGTGGKFEAWIAAGETVNVTILPNSGYQYIKNTLNINGGVISTVPGEKKGGYSFTMPANAGHICAGFIKTEDVVEVGKDSGIKNAAIGVEEGVIGNGNAKLEVTSADPDDNTKKKIEEVSKLSNAEAIYLDMQLNEIVVKNYDPSQENQDAWETNLTDLDKPVLIGIYLPDGIDKDTTIEVVRVHGEDVEVIECRYDEEYNGIVFATDKFSVYSIVYKKGHKLVEGGDQTVTEGESGDLIIKVSGKVEDLVDLVIDDKTVPKEYYTVAQDGENIVITIKSEYVNTIPKGAHVLKVVFNDGDVTTNFTVNKKAPEPEPTPTPSNPSPSNPSDPGPIKDNVPKTGESNNMLYILGLLSLVSILGMGVAFKGVKANRK